MNVTGYQIFLMVELARIAGLIEKELEYDTTWEMAQVLYGEFENSKFDDSNQPEYECIEKFLKDKVDTELRLFLSTCEVSFDGNTEEYIEDKLANGFYSLKINNVNYWVDGKLYTLANDGTLILSIGNGLTVTLTTW